MGFPEEFIMLNFKIKLFQFLKWPSYSEEEEEKNMRWFFSVYFDTKFVNLKHDKTPN